MAQLELDPKTTALVLIDLQHGIVGMPVKPHSGQEVVERSVQLASALRAKGGTVVYVRVEIGEVLRPAVDMPMHDPNAAPPPPIASQLVPNCGVEDGDVLIVKRQWGAFYGTGLEQQLRRRGIRTVIMGGIATNLGVESTARGAFDHGYALVFAEDACSSLNADMHAFAMTKMFPIMGRVRTTAQLLEALGQ